MHQYTKAPERFKKWHGSVAQRVGVWGVSPPQLTRGLGSVVKHFRHILCDITLLVSGREKYDFFSPSVGLQ